MKSFLYLHSSDLAVSRRFYTELVGLNEIYFSDTDQSVGYQHGTLQLTISADPETSTATGWARQLGWEGGTGSRPSWGLELAADAFAAAVRSVVADGAVTWTSEPSWVGYWSFPVQDPMGQTVELSASDRYAWPPAAG